MNSNHKYEPDKKQETNNHAPAAKTNVPKGPKDIKSEAETGDNCGPDPLKGMSYIPPKDENTL